MTFLWLKAVKKAHSDFAQSLQLAPADIEVAWMAQWTFMCFCEKLEVAEITYQLGRITTANPQLYISYIWRGISLAARDRWKDGLELLDKALKREPRRGDAFFWKAMLCAYLGPDMQAQAVKAFKMAQELALPPALFAPVHWLKQDRPDFYQRHILPLLGSGGEEHEAS
jgi:tetratricopeptide (TPR) repeat protein